MKFGVYQAGSMTTNMGGIAVFRTLVKVWDDLGVAQAQAEFLNGTRAEFTYFVVDALPETVYSYRGLD